MSVSATVGRLVRWSTYAPESADYWPGKTAKSRPPVWFPGVGPCGGPGESFQNVVVLQSDLSAHVRAKGWSELSCPPPVSAIDRVSGSKGPAPKFPLRVLGLPRETLQELFGASDAPSRGD